MPDKIELVPIKKKDNDTSSQTICEKACDLDDKNFYKLITNQNTNEENDNDERFF